MLEKSPANSNNSDATIVGSADDDGKPLLHSESLSATPDGTLAYTNTDSYSYASSGTYTPLRLGSLIKNTFELVEVLGEGGMGTVFKALNKVWQEVEARDPYVAIKVLKPELSANKQLVRSLYSDFDRTKMLANCPNIIKVQGFDRDGSHVYMTMEFLSGKTLGDYLNHSALNLEQAWFIIEGIGNALAYAHENNIVHRDIKPGNVIITKENIVKVLDFGIASKINESEGDETKFGGHELGALTVAYAAPEMQRDFPPDARDDIYAFACVIYEILTGKQFYKQKIHKAAPILGLNGRQMDALNKALAFERDERTPNIRELLDKLRPVKTSWVKYASIGGVGVLIAGLLVVLMPYFSQPVEVKKPPVVEPSIEVKKPPVVEPSIEVKKPPVVEPSIEVKNPPVVKPLIEIKPPLFQFGTSSDGIVHLTTSKPEYKNGEPFKLTFTLTQPRYVRVIDRDVKGETTNLRPNPRQPDKLLPANKEHIFPPKDVNIRVEGIAGESTVTIVTSEQPFATTEFLNPDGSVTEQIKNDGYSWVQVHYNLR
jgi:serine/threonine protein kinase